MQTEINECPKCGSRAMWNNSADGRQLVCQNEECDHKSDQYGPDDIELCVFHWNNERAMNEEELAELNERKQQAIADGAAQEPATQEEEPENDEGSEEEAGEGDDGAPEKEEGELSPEEQAHLEGGAPTDDENSPEDGEGKKKGIFG